MDIDTLCESTKLRLVANALGLQQCTKTAACIIPITGTQDVIAIGPRAWIAKNVPGVEAMVGDLTDERIEQLMRDHCIETREFPDSFVIDFARAIEREVTTRLATTTQASTAQAEPDDAAEGLELLDSLIANIDRSGNYSVEATLTFLGQIRQCFATTSSTDAQAVAEVRDAVLEEAAKLCESEDQKYEIGRYCAAAIRALRAGDTGEQADGGAAQ